MWTFLHLRCTIEDARSHFFTPSVTRVTIIVVHEINSLNSLPTMSTSSTARSSSSSSFTARPADYPAVKEVPAIPKKPKTTPPSPPSPRMTLAREKKVLRRLKKTKIRKTEKGSVAKVRRRYPGTASLRDTSSEGSVSASSGRVSVQVKLKSKAAKLVDNANSGGDGNKLDQDANSGVEFANLVETQGNANSGIQVAKLVGDRGNANSGGDGNKLVGNVDVGYPEVEQDNLVGRKVDSRDAQDDVSTLGTGELVGTTHSSTSHSRWIRLFTEASSFHDQTRLLSDDVTHLIEGLHKSFPNLRRVQDLEEYTSYKRIMVSDSGNQKLILLLCVIYLSYATPTSMTLEDRSSTMYLFNFTYTSLRDNFSRVWRGEIFLSAQTLVKLSRNEV